MAAGSFGAGQVEGIMGRLTKSLTDIADAFEAAVSPLKKFVDAISPGQVQVFNLAMRDLNATIGSAFIPVMQVMTEGVRRAAAILNPAVDALAPAFRSLSEALLSFMLPAVQTTSHALKSMSPLIEGIGDALHLLGDFLGVVNVIMLSLKDALGDFFKALVGGGAGGGLKSIFDQIKEGLQRFLVTLITVSAQIAKAFGATGFIEHLQKNLQELTKTTGGKGGVSGVHITGLEQISKDLAQAAATAAGGGQKGRGIEDIANEALKQIGDIASGVTPLSKEVTTLVKTVLDIYNFLKAASSGVAEQAQAVGQAASNAAQTVKEAAKKVFWPF